MKKFVRYGALTLVLAVVFLSGCSPNKAHQLLNNSVDQVNKAQSYKFEGNIDMKVNGQSAEAIKFNGVFKSPEAIYTKYSRNYNGETQSFETFQSDKKNYYSKTGTAWEKADAQTVEQINQSNEGTGTTDVLKSIKNNAKIVYQEKDQTINGKKYKVLKIVSNTKNLRQSAEKSVRDNIELQIQQAGPQDKATVDELNNQMNQFLKSLKISEISTIYIDATSNKVFKIVKEQKLRSVIDKQVLDNVQTFTMNFIDYNQPVELPKVS